MYVLLGVKNVVVSMSLECMHIVYITIKVGVAKHSWTSWPRLLPLSLRSIFKSWRLCVDISKEEARMPVSSGIGVIQGSEIGPVEPSYSEFADAFRFMDHVTVTERRQ